jgi:hypothetical protein
VFSSLNSLKAQASITSPDPELNSEARGYFTRHMRILEECIPHWPLPEVQAQVNSLREAFSADISKPFELKPSFPYGSPTAQTASPIDGAYTQQQHIIPRPPVAAQGVSVSLDTPAQVSYTTAIIQHPITPPVSTTDEAPKADSPVVQGMAMIGNHGQVNHGVQPPDGYQQQWNPTKIFE